MAKRIDTKKDLKRFRPVAVHSLLLALEPRQVFDGAVGAAIAEVIDNSAPTDQTDQADTQDSGDQIEAEGLRLEGGAADQGAANGPDSLLGAVGGHEPVLHLADQEALLSAGEFDLGRLSVIDFDEGENHTLVLRAENGRFSAPEKEGLSLEDDGRTLTFRNMSVLEINRSLAECAFTADQPGASAAIEYHLDDPVTEPVVGRLELAGDDGDPDHSEPAPMLMRSDLFGPMAILEGVDSDSEEGLTVSINVSDQAIGGNGYLPGQIGNGGTALLNGISVLSEDSAEEVILRIEAKIEDGNTLEGEFKVSQIGNVRVETGTGWISLSGTAADINTLLCDTANGNVSYLSYVSDNSKQAAHAVALVFTLDRVGDPVSGQAPSVAHTVSINYTPTLTAKPEFTGKVQENSLSADPAGTILNFGGLEVADANPGDLLDFELKLTLTNDQALGQLSLPANWASQVTAWDAQTQSCQLTDGHTLSITGATAAQVNQILALLQFQGEANIHGKQGFEAKVTDSQGQSDGMEGELTITFVNDPPLVNPPTKTDYVDHLKAFEGGSTALTVDVFGVDDVTLDGSDASALSEITITLSGNPGQGNIVRYNASDIITNVDGDKVTFTVREGARGILQGAGCTFTLQDVTDGLIWYYHDGSPVNRADVLNGSQNPPMDSFRFSVNDGSGPVTGYRYKENDVVHNTSEPLAVYINLSPVNKGFEVGAGEQGSTTPSDNVLWVWEDQQGAYLVKGHAGDDSDHVRPGQGIWLTTGDDNLSDFAVTVTKLPERGTLYLLYGDGTRVELKANDKFNAEDLQYLRYDDNQTAKNETDHVNYPTFALSFTDHQGSAYENRTAIDGFSLEQDQAITVTNVTFTIKIADNNDDPTLAHDIGSIGNGDNDCYIISNNSAHNPDSGSRFVPITKAMLQVVDDDSKETALTYTVTDGPEFGMLVRNVGTTANPIWVKIGLNDTFSQDDVDKGRICYYADKSNDAGQDFATINTYFEFTVTDGGINSWPDAGRAGGIYDYVQDADGRYTIVDGRYVYAGPDTPAGERYSPTGLTKFVFNIDVILYQSGPGEEWQPAANQAPKITPGIIPRIYEAGGGSEYPSELILLGGRLDGVNGNRIDLNGNIIDSPKACVLNLYDPDTNPADITFSLDCGLKGGAIYVQYSENGPWVELHYGGKFSYDLMMAGRVKYVHEGGEVFQESIKFKVCDASNSDTGDVYAELALKIAPYNDPPEISGPSTATVIEGDEVIFNGGTAITVTDPDGGTLGYSPNGADLTGETLPGDTLTISFTQADLPRHGTLYYYDTNAADWVEITAATTLTPAQLGNLRYVHSGLPEDDPTKTGCDRDSFTITVTDQSPTLSNGETVPGVREGVKHQVLINVKAINNPPIVGTVQDITAREYAAGTTPTTANGGQVVIWGPNDQGGTVSLNFNDQDHSPESIIYSLTAGCKYGDLYKIVNGVKTQLSKGSTFTQADLNLGRIVYEHNGRNQHQDNFSFMVLDGSKYYVNSNGHTAAEVFAGQLKDAATLTLGINIVPYNEAPYFKNLDPKFEIWYDNNPDGISLYDTASGQQLQIGDLDAERGYDPLAENTLRGQMTLEISVYEKNWNYRDANHDTTAGDGTGIPSITGSVAFDGVYSGLSLAGGNGVWTLTGTMEQLNEALKHLTFKTNTDTNTTYYITFKVNDMNNGGNPATPQSTDTTGQAGDTALEAFRFMRIHSSIENDAPTIVDNKATSNLTAWEDERIQIFGSSNSLGGTITFNDDDAFDTTTNSLTVSLPAGTGTISYYGNLRITGGANNSASLTLTGSLSDLNKALANLYYTSPANQSGQTEITVTYCDQGNTGKDTSGNPAVYSASHVVTVTVNPVNDTPEVAVTDSGKTQSYDGKSYITYEISNSSQNFGNDYFARNLSGLIKISDPKDTTNAVGFDGLTGVDISTKDGFKVTLIPTNVSGGTITGQFLPTDGFPSWDAFITAKGLSVVEDTSTGSLTITGKMSHVQAALDQLSFVMDKATAEGPDAPTIMITVKVDDGYNGYTNPAAGGQHSPQDISTCETAFLVNVSVKNYAPTIKGDPITINEDLYGDNASTGVNLKDKMGLGIEDKDAYQDKVLYKIELVDANGNVVNNTVGTLYLSGVALTGNSSGNTGYVSDTDPRYNNVGLTVEQLNTLLATLSFKPGTDWNGEVYLRLTVNDKGHTGETATGDLVNGGRETVETFKITVNPVNDAPTLTSNTAVDLTSVPEDSTDHAGQTLDSLLSSRFQDLKDSKHTGQGGTFKGVFVVGNTCPNTKGEWQYWDANANGGSGGWVTIGNGTYNDTNALYLDKGAAVRFLPAENYFGNPPNLTVRLVEDSPVTAPYASEAAFNAFYGASLVTGATRDLNSDTVNAAYRPYTTGTNGKIDLKVTVTNVNDAPVWKDNVEIPKVTVKEDATSDTANPGHLVSDLFGNNCDDSADNSDGGNLGGFGGILITAVHTNPTTEGVWQYHDGTSWKTISLTDSDHAFFVKAGDKLRFNPADNYHGSPAGGLTIRLADHSAGAPTSSGEINKPAASDTGGTSCYTATTREVAVEVTPVNDAPVRPGNAPGLVNKLVPVPSVDNTASFTGWKVSYLAAGQFSDPKDAGQPNGADSAQGMMIIDADTNGCTGKWQYSVDNGTSWTDFPAGLSATKGLYLDNDTQVRFLGDPGAGSGNSAAHAYLKCLVVETDSNNDAAPISFTNGKSYALGDASTGGESRISDRDDPWMVKVTFSDAKISAPEITVSNTAKVVKENAPTALTLSDLKFKDIDYNDTLTVTLTAGHGQVSQAGGVTPPAGLTATATGDGQGLILTGTYNQINAFINSAGVLYTGEADYNGSDAVSITVADSADTPHEVSATLAVTVTPVNDAPVLADNETPITKDIPPNIGGPYTQSSWTVGELAGAKFTDPKDILGSYPGDSLQGILITDTTKPASGGIEGTWYYQKPGDSGWTAFSVDPLASDGTQNPLYLTTDTTISFVPLNNQPGQASLSFLVVENDGNNGQIDVPTADQFQLNNGERHDPLTAGNTGGTTQISDKDQPGQLVVSVSNAKIYGPTVSVGSGITLAEDGSIALSGPDLSFHDHDYQDQLTVTLTAGHGSLSVDGTVTVPTGLTIVAGGDGRSLELKGTYDLINDFIDSGGLRYAGDADYNGSDAIGITVADSADTPHEVSDSLAITVTPVNDAPVRPDEALDEVVKSVRVNSGLNTDDLETWTVAELAEGQFGDPNDAKHPHGIADAFQGILVIEATTATGAWQYWDGGSWQDFPQVSADNPLYLDQGTEIRFKGNEGTSSGDAHIKCLVVETDDNGDDPASLDPDFFTNGQTVDISAYGTGNTTRISAKDKPWAVTVAFDSSDHYPPTISPGADISIPEDTSVALTGITITDKDYGNTLTVTLTAEHGNFSLDPAKSTASLTIVPNGSTLTLTGTHTQISKYFQDGGVLYTGHQDFNGSDAISISVADSASAHPAVTDSLAVTITPVNDAPVLDNTTPIEKDIPPNIGGTYTQSSWTVAELAGAKFSDPNDVLGSYPGDSLQGILITDTTKPANGGIDGTWYYKKPGDQGWTAFSADPSATDGTENPLYLTTDTKISFVPDNNKPGQATLSFLLVENDGNNGQTDVPTADQFQLSNGERHDTLTAGNTGGTTQISDKDNPGQLLVSVSDAKIYDPTVSVGSGITLAEDGSVALSGPDLSFHDHDYADQLTVTLTAGHGSLVADGTVTVPTGLTIVAAGGDGRSLKLIGTYDLINDFINSGGLRYAGDANYNGSDTIEVQVTDSGDNSRQADLAVTIDPVNDAPQRPDGAADLVRKEVPVYSGSNDIYFTGWTVADLAAGQFADPNDAGRANGADDFQGVLIIAAETDGCTGQWQYWEAGQNKWVDFPAGLSADKGLYLAKDSTVRFIGGVGEDSGRAGLKCLLVENDANNDAAPASFDQGQTYDLDNAATGGETRISHRSDPWTVEVGFFEHHASVPEITVAGSPKTIKEDEPSPLSLADLSFNDIDHHDTLTVTLTADHGRLSPADGVLPPTGLSIKPSGQGLVLTGTSDQINSFIQSDGLLYTGHLDYNGPDAIHIEVQDSHQPTANRVTADLNLSVAPVNDAPVIIAPEAEITRQLPPNIGGAYPDQGWTVGELAGAKFSDPKDGAGSGDSLQGLLITDTTKPASGGLDGGWYYKNPGDADWTEFKVDPSATDGTEKPLYLSRDSQIRFVPADNRPGQAALSFLIVETDGQGGPADVPAGQEFILNSGERQALTDGDTGGSTQISDWNQPGRLVVTVSEEKIFAPEISTGSGLKVAEDTAAALTLADLKFSDHDFEDRLTVTLTAGRGQLSLDGTAPRPQGLSLEPTADGRGLILKGTAEAINSFIDQGGLRYTGDLDYYGPDAIRIEVADSASPAAHTSSGSLSVTVSPVNDAPVIIGSEAAVLPSATNTQTPPGQTVGRLFEGRLDDSRDRAEYEGRLQGLLVVADASNPTQGHWEYSLDDGSTWRALPAVSPGGALYLASGDLLRFLPQAGFTGQPGALTVHLVESLPDQRPYQAGEWPAFTGGSSYDLSGNSGPNAVAPDFRGYTRENLELRTQIERGQSGGQIREQSSHPSGDSHWTADKIKTTEGPQTPVFKREGLDSPQDRSAQGGTVATDTIITDTHIGAVIQGGNGLLSQSISQGLTLISAQAPGSGLLTGSPETASAPSQHYWGLNSAGLVESDGQGYHYLDLTGLGLGFGEDPDLRYEARMADGSPLPEWIHFDPISLAITVTDYHRVLEECQIHVIALETKGDRLALEVLLKPEDLENEPPSESARPDEDPVDPDQAEKALNEAAASFRDLWFDQPELTADRPGSQEIVGDADLDQKMAQLPSTMDSLKRAAEELLTALRG